MTISPVYQVNSLLQVSKDSPRRISMVGQTSDSTSYAPKDTITISSAAREMATKMSTQNNLSYQPTNYLNATQQSALLTTNTTIMKTSSGNYSAPIQTPRQKDLAAFLAGKSFQEEMDESLIEKLQEKFDGDLD